MTIEDIARVQADFAATAARARAAGFEWLELHFAHGYLAQSFRATPTCAPMAMAAMRRGARRFLLESLAAVRAVWPETCR
jgi:hypothetical protein